MDICDEGIALAGLIEEKYLALTPVNLEAVRDLREAQHHLASRQVSRVDRAVCDIDMWADLYRAFHPDEEDAWDLLDRVRGWMRRVEEETWLMVSEEMV
jgi:hypothetical protein